MVEVFRTNINSLANAHLAESGLMLLYPNIEISFDLEDPDRVFRVESHSNFDKYLILNYFKRLGYQIQIIK